MSSEDSREKKIATFLITGKGVLDLKDFYIRKHMIARQINVGLCSWLRQQSYHYN